MKDYQLERAEIKVQSVKGVRLLDPELTGSFKIAYIRLIQFNEPTAEELSKALDGLQKQGMQALILDLRNNPGGLLDSAVDVCAQFLPPNTKVVSTQGRGDRLRRAQGPPSGDRCRRNNLWKGLSSKCDAAAGRIGLALHDREILHAEQASDSR